VCHLLHGSIPGRQDVNGAELPLCLAAEFEHTQMIALLLELSADVNATNQRGHTPLQYGWMDGWMDDLIFSDPLLK
jgi:ankyrin repeat protein